MPELQKLLDEFQPLFEEPLELPPKRIFYHHIPLYDESKPINVHPYKYVHYQKEKIEKQVREMLDKDLVRPSSSPYLSPILLVKKKGGTW